MGFINNWDPSKIVDLRLWISLKELAHPALLKRSKLWLLVPER